MFALKSLEKTRNTASYHLIAYLMKKYDVKRRASQPLRSNTINQYKTMFIRFSIQHSRQNFARSQIYRTPATQERFCAVRRAAGRCENSEKTDPTDPTKTHRRPQKKSVHFFRPLVVNQSLLLSWKTINTHHYSHNTLE
jgi:hypothetical protein